MSVSKKGVSFTEKNGDGERGSRKTIPVGVAPNAVAMNSNKTGTGKRTEDEFRDETIRTGIDQQFPTDGLTDDDPRDALMEMKQGLQVEGQPGVTPLGVMQAKDSDFEYLLDKEMLGLEGDFQQWFATYFDKASPEEKAWARQAFPKFYAQRLALLKQDVAQAEQLAELSLMGIKDEQDLYLQYAKEKGLININRLNNLINPELGNAEEIKGARDKRYVRGLLSSRARPRGDWAGSRAVNAREVTGKNGKAFPFKAYNSGVDGNAFSAIPGMTHENEKKMRTAALLKGLFTNGQ